MRRVYQVYLVMTVEANSKEQMEWVVQKVHSNVRDLRVSLEGTGGYSFPDGGPDVSFEDLEEVVHGGPLSDEELQELRDKGEAVHDVDDQG